MDSNLNGGEGRLYDIWNRRGALSSDELVELYKRVCVILLPIARMECAALPDTPESYIQEFALEKILIVRETHTLQAAVYSDAQTSTYIRNSFRFFVSDIRRTDKWSDSKVDYHSPEELDATPGAAISAFGGERSFFSPVETLASVGISIEVLVAQATAFALSLTSDERLFLFYNTCVDADDSRAERRYGKAAIPLSRLRHQFAITNYDRKARKLGITGKGSGYVEDFRGSKIGKWMVSIGLQIDRNHWAEMEAALQVLCGVIFELDNWGEEK